jgi:hypothetical protein
MLEFPRFTPVFPRWGGFGFVVFFGALTSGCGISGSGVLVEKELTFDSYDSISLSNGLEGHVVMGDEFRVRIVADDNLIEYMGVEYVDGQVAVSFGKNNPHNATLEVELTLPVLSRVTVNDGSVLYAHNALAEEDLELIARDGSEVVVSLNDDSLLTGLSLEVVDGSSIEFDGSSEETIVDVGDGSRAELDGGGGMQMSASVQDGSSLTARGYEIDEFSCSIVDGSFAKVTVAERVTGSVKDGSNLEIWGDPGVDVSVSDGSSVTHK